MYTNNFYFGCIAVSCFFETFPGGWLAGWGWPAGWVVGKSDFNENPVVSPDLDLDFGLRLMVCQKFKASEMQRRPLHIGYLLWKAFFPRSATAPMPVLAGS